MLGEDLGSENKRQSPERVNPTTTEILNSSQGDDSSGNLLLGRDLKVSRTQVSALKNYCL